jgi:hypothetical protein
MVLHDFFDLVVECVHVCVCVCVCLYIGLHAVELVGIENGRVVGKYVPCM